MNERPVALRHKGLAFSQLRINDHNLDEKLPTVSSEGCQIRCHQPVVYDLGALDTLPVELLDGILCQLDLRTLTDFRRVNRRAIELVNALPSYKAIITHIPNALTGILAIRAGRWIMCRTLFEKLCAPTCEECGDFGGYLYLITCKRVCFLCFTHEKAYLPLSSRAACREFGLKSGIVETLPHMLVVPGTYAPNMKKASGTILIDYQSALCAGVLLHGSVNAMEKYVSRAKARDMEAYEKRLNASKRSGARVRLPYSSDSVDLNSANPFRYVAIVRVPWLDRPAREIEWGFHCSGCENSNRLPLHYRRQFTTLSFDEHLIQCGRIQDGQHSLESVQKEHHANA
jgi:hypothetical protein